MDPDLIRKDLKVNLIGRHVVMYREVDSTNRVAHDYAAKNVAEGCVIFAESQTAGRGRKGRQWASPGGSNLYFSILLRPKISMKDMQPVTLMIAQALQRALLIHHPSLSLTIKEPNDLYCGDKKICGILTEAQGDWDCAHYLVIGIGLNVNSVYPDIPPTATSLQMVTGKSWSREELARHLLTHLDQEYGKFLSSLSSLTS